MSLSHLGVFSDPVFDAALPTKQVLFPVARRTVSHAARSLFAGKLLFPVSIPGKEGQHCFAADPRRLFRMPRVKHSADSVLPAVVSRTDHVFAPPPPAGTEPQPRLDISKRRLPPRPELLPRAPVSCGTPDLSLAEAEARPAVRALHPPVKGFREPLYLQKCLISRFEMSRLRRMAPASDWQSSSSPHVELIPASPPPEAWKWFALSTLGSVGRASARIRPLQAGPLDPPRPRLLSPTAPRRPSIAPPAWKFLAYGRRALPPWRPSCRLPAGRIPILPFHRRLPFAELISAGPSHAPKDHSVYFYLYICDSLSVQPHSFPAMFGIERGRTRPAAHTGISPELLPQRSLSAPSGRTGTVTEIITNISRSRLADIRGAPPTRLVRKWPHAAFLSLRQLLCRKPFAKRFEFSAPEPPGFRLIAPRTFASLQAFSGSLDAAGRHGESDVTRAKPVVRRSCGSFGHSPKERFLTRADLHLFDARVTDLRISAIQPALVLFPGETARKGVRQALGILRRRAVAEKALFIPGEKPRARFESSPLPVHVHGEDSGLRIPVPAMQVLGLTAVPRGPRPPAPPRRLPPAGEPERMLRLIASLPRRSHSTRHYLLTLESALTGWKQFPHSRRTRLAPARAALFPRSWTVSRKVMLPDEFTAVSPREEPAFLTTDIRTSSPSLHEVALPAARRIVQDRPRITSASPIIPASVAGARFLDAPEWLRPVRQPRMKVRYWPTFYELPPSARADAMRLSENGRTVFPAAEASPHLTPLAGMFGIRRRDRPRGPYSMRRPKRWLLKTDAAATGVPDAYHHETTFPTTSPSRLDSAERLPPAFMGPAFRSPWTSVVISPDEFRQFSSERAAPPSPERIPHCRASTRPAVEAARAFQEVPMPRAITTARLPPLSPPGESLEIRFGVQAFRPVGHAVSGARCDPPADVRFGSLQRVEAFIELRPDLFADEFREPAAGGGFFIRDLLCDLIVARGGHRARWRSLFFPYKPDVSGIDTASTAPLEPAPDSLAQSMLDTKEPLDLEPGLLAMEQNPGEPPTVRTEKTASPYAPDHVRDEAFSRLPVLLPDVFGFDILEAPAAPAEEWDFSTSMYVPFIPAPLPKLLPHADRFALSPSPFPQAFSEPAPSVPWPSRHITAAEAFPSLEQPAGHSIIIAGRWNRRLPVDGGFRVPHATLSPSVFSGVHRLELPTLPKDAYQALHIVDLAPAEIACHVHLPPVAPPPVRLAIPAPSGLMIAPGTAPASRTTVLPFVQMPLNMTAGRYRLHDVSGRRSGRRISFRKQEFGFVFSPFAIFPSLVLPTPERKERRFSSKFKTALPGQAAAHPAAIPDWLELSSARPACRPPGRPRNTFIMR